MSLSEREKALGIHFSDPPLVIRDGQHVDDLVAHIAASTGDPESAHWTLDQLALGTLRAIAAGAENPADLAARALKADDIECERWYA